MRWLGPVLAFWIIAALFMADGAADETFCTDRTEMLNQLAAKWGEELIEVVVVEGRGQLEMLASPTKGTWTVLLTQSNGISCIMAVGEGLSTSKDSLEKMEYVL